MRREPWQVGERVSWDGQRGARNQGKIVAVWQEVVAVRWEDGTYSRIVAGSPWLKRSEDERAEAE